MLKFLAIRTSKHAPAGTWFMAEEVGEPLFRCKLEAGPRGAKLIQVSRVGIPFDHLAPYIVEPGFVVPRKLLNDLSKQSAVQEVVDFQQEYEEIIDEELRKREIEAEPSVIGQSGIIVPGGKNGNENS